MTRADLKPGEVLCEYCTAKCCRYFALPIDTPKTREDFDHLRWYMIHRRVSLFVEDGTWYLMVHADCEHLMEDNRCGIYEDRPEICRKYTTDECEFDDDTCYDQFFETAEQIWEYAEAILPPKKRRHKDAPVELPVLSG
ncbi:MAG: YkgJ family cysteine cluster protein [Planctomycetaceae bacterium]